MKSSRDTSQVLRTRRGPESNLKNSFCFLRQDPAEQAQAALAAQAASMRQVGRCDNGVDTVTGAHCTDIFWRSKRQIHPLQTGQLHHVKRPQGLAWISLDQRPPGSRDSTRFCDSLSRIFVREHRKKHLKVERPEPLDHINEVSPVPDEDRTPIDHRGARRRSARSFGK